MASLPLSPNAAKPIIGFVVIQIPFCFNPERLAASR